MVKMKWGTWPKALHYWEGIRLLEVSIQKVLLALRTVLLDIFPKLFPECFASHSFSFLCSQVTHTPWCLIAINHKLSFVGLHSMLCNTIIHRWTTNRPWAQGVWGLFVWFQTSELLFTSQILFSDSNKSGLVLIDGCLPWLQKSQSELCEQDWEWGLSSFCARARKMATKMTTILNEINPAALVVAHWPTETTSLKLAYLFHQCEKVS